MHRITKHLHRVPLAVRRFVKRMRHRPITLEAKLTIAVPPFLKLEIGLKSEPAKPANDNAPVRTTRRAE